MAYTPSATFSLTTGGYTPSTAFAFIDTEVGIKVISGRLAYTGAALQTNAQGPEQAQIGSGRLRYTGGLLNTVSSSLRGGASYRVTVQESHDWYYLSGDLNSAAADYWPPYCATLSTDLTAAALTSTVPVETVTFALPGALRARNYRDDYYYRVHILPNPIALGNVLSAVTLSIEVWNAWPDAQLLTSVTSDNATGVSLTAPEAGETTFGAMESRLYSLVVALEGPATIDAGFTFAWPGQITRLGVTGARTTVFPIAPNWKAPVLERLEWLTEILTLRNGTEQRLRLRQNPRQSLEYEVLAMGDTLNLLGSLLFGWQGRSWAVPLWFHGQPLGALMLAGSTAISCATAGYEFQAGGYALLYLSDGRFEALQVGTVTGAGLTTVTAALHDWPAGTTVLPMRIARIKDEVTVQYYNGEIATCVLRFWSEQTLTLPSTVTAAYQGLPVLEVEPNRVAVMDEKWSRRTTVKDNGVGPSYVVDKLPFSNTTRSHAFLALNRAQAQACRNLFYYAQGRWKEFWSPSFNRDLQLAEDVTATQDWLTVRYVQYHLMVNQHPARRDLRLALATGQIYYRRIIASDDVNTPAGTEKLVLDAALPAGFAKAGVVISFMSLARLDADAVEFNWTTPAIASAAVPIRSGIN